MEQDMSKSHQSHHPPPSQSQNFAHQPQYQQPQYQQPQYTPMGEHPVTRTTNITSFQNDLGNYSSMHQYQPARQGQFIKSLDTKLLAWNKDDAIFVVCVTAIAFVFLYPSDISFIYSKFTILEQFHKYELIVRAVLLATALYFVLRKFRK
jgi:hypothetical protein